MSTTQNMDVTGIPVWKILEALYLSGLVTQRAQDIAVPAALVRFLNKDRDVTQEMLEEATQDGRLPDYYLGTPIKVNLVRRDAEGSWVLEGGRVMLERADLYDRDHGEGACKKAMKSLLSYYWKEVNVGSEMIACANACGPASVEVEEIGPPSEALRQAVQKPRAIIDILKEVSAMESSLNNFFEDRGINLERWRDVRDYRDVPYGQDWFCRLEGDLYNHFHTEYQKLMEEYYGD